MSPTKQTSNSTSVSLSNFARLIHQKQIILKLNFYLVSLDKNTLPSKGCNCNVHCKKRVWQEFHQGYFSDTSNYDSIFNCNGSEWHPLKEDQYGQRHCWEFAEEDRWTFSTRLWWMAGGTTIWVTMLSLAIHIPSLRREARSTLNYNLSSHPLIITPLLQQRHTNCAYIDGKFLSRRQGHDQSDGRYG